MRLCENFDSVSHVYCLDAFNDKIHLDRNYCKIIFVLVESLVAGIKIGIYIY